MVHKHGDIMCSELKNVSEKNSSGIFMHELAHHLPYGTLSVACALMLISLIDVFFASGIVEATLSTHSHTIESASTCCGSSSRMDILFHSFHFVHTLFAVSGSMITFYRYSKNVLAGAIIGMISSSIFCTLSDILLPYAAGALLGVSMDLHICFFSELENILPFLLVGVLNGLVMNYVKDFKTEKNSLQLHFFHTFISAMASVFYAVGHGLPNFHAHFGIFFLLMLVAVVLPCTLADVVVPIVFARIFRTK